MAGNTIRSLGKTLPLAIFGGHRHLANAMGVGSLLRAGVKVIRKRAMA